MYWFAKLTSVRKQLRTRSLRSLDQTHHHPRSNPARTPAARSSSTRCRLPYDNPWNALFFVTGVDFLPDGRIAICTAHGDVWTREGQRRTTLEWHRFATGLYQPLGSEGRRRQDRRRRARPAHATARQQQRRRGRLLREPEQRLAHRRRRALVRHLPRNRPRGQLLPLQDRRRPHADRRLPAQDLQGRVASRRSSATGFRHPIGLGMSPDGKISGADQEGNWMPVTRLDMYKKGGFYGDMRTHHRAEPPTDLRRAAAVAAQGGGQLGRRPGLGAEGRVGRARRQHAAPVVWPLQGVTRSCPMATASRPAPSTWA